MMRICSPSGRRATANETYLLYYDVMSPAVLDMILETAIRMKMNLVIPSSFDLEDAVSDQLRALLGEDFARIEPLLWEYYAAIGDRGRDEIRCNC